MNLHVFGDAVSVVFGFKVRLSWMMKAYKAIRFWGLTFGHWSVGVSRWDKSDAGADPR